MADNNSSKDKQLAIAHCDMPNMVARFNATELLACGLLVRYNLIYPYFAEY
ncbi:MAG TPA: hypothetical protein VFC46_13860 [Humisphaera sp.]|nr:hypothetical protein [Humisphaera sp.]